MLTKALNQYSWFSMRRRGYYQWAVQLVSIKCVNVQVSPLSFKLMMLVSATWKAVLILAPSLQHCNIAQHYTTKECLWNKQMHHFCVKNRETVKETGFIVLKSASIVIRKVSDEVPDMLHHSQSFPRCRLFGRLMIAVSHNLWICADHRCWVVGWGAFLIKRQMSRGRDTHTQALGKLALFQHTVIAMLSHASDEEWCKEHYAPHKPSRCWNYRHLSD